MVQSQNNLIQSQDNLIEFQILPNSVVLQELINTNNTVRSFWGIAPTAPLHLGYDSLILAQKELIRLGFTHTILLADYHAMLTHGYSFEEASKRAIYYENYFRHCCGLPITFVRGSSFQTRQDYIELLYSTLSIISVLDVKNSLSKVSKSSGTDNVKIASYIYGIMQCLDCYYLGANVVLAEWGQAKIYRMFDILQQEDLNDRSFNGVLKQSYKRESFVFTYIATGFDIKGQSLNQSHSQTRISIHETENSLKKKIDAMFAAPPEQILPEDRVNAILEYFKYSVFPWRSQPIEVLDIDGNQRTYSLFDSFQSDYQLGILHPNDCKNSLFSALWERLSLIQASMGSCICDWIDFRKIC